MSSNNINNIFSPSYQTQQIMNIMKGGVNYPYKADSALSNKIDKDTLEKQGCTDGKDDGKITFGEKVKNFAKGIIAPVTTMFKSPKNFLIGAGMIAGTAALIAATGGAAAPVLAAAGVIGGGIQIGINANKAKNAATDIQAKEAWQGMGTGTTAVVGSAIGAKSALKASGSDTSKMGIIKSTFECIKQAPANLKKSVDAFKTGAFITNLKSALHIKSKTEKSINEKKPITESSETTAPTAPVDTPDVPIEPSQTVKPDHQDIADVPNTQAKVDIDTPETTAPTAPVDTPDVPIEPSQTVKPDHQDIADVPNTQAKVDIDTPETTAPTAPADTPDTPIETTTDSSLSDTLLKQDPSDLNKKAMENSKALGEEAAKGQQIVQDTADMLEGIDEDLLKTNENLLNTNNGSKSKKPGLFGSLKDNFLKKIKFLNGFTDNIT